MEVAETGSRHGCQVPLCCGGCAVGVSSKEDSWEVADLDPLFPEPLPPVIHCLSQPAPSEVE